VLNHHERTNLVHPRLFVNNYFQFFFAVVTGDIANT